jgi:hypothetical protein
MKWKAAVTRTAPPALLDAINSEELYDRLCEEIGVACLHVKPEDIGPATHFNQEADLTIPSKKKPALGCNVALTMVSVTRNRCDEDFTLALDELQRIFREVIEENLPIGMQMQLYCALALDDEIMDRNHHKTKLPELGPIWVEGKASGGGARIRSSEGKGGR